MIGTVDPAIADLSLDFGIPAVDEKIMTGKIDDSVATVNLLLPAAFRRGVALDDLVLAKLGLAPDHVGVPREDHRVVSVIQQPAGQVATDQPRAARDENPHEHCLPPYVGESLCVKQPGQAGLNADATPGPFISPPCFSGSRALVKHPPVSRRLTLAAAHDAVTREFTMNSMRRLLATREDRGRFSTLDALRWPCVAFETRATDFDVSSTTSLRHPGVPANHAPRRSQMV